MTLQVLFEEVAGVGGAVGVIQLNRPEALNSLNIPMVEAIHAQLKAWSIMPSIKAVIIRAVPGRAFCAGGDLRFTYERMQTNSANAAAFFLEEYQLNRCIYHYPKPYIAFLDGITMGGGVGISIHGSHRVATEKLLFAMPETGIGFFPDVGGTYFLPRLSGKLGYYLGLVGTRLGPDDCVALNLAQFKVPSEQLNNILNAIAAEPFGNNANESVSSVLNQFKQTTSHSTLIEQQQEINECFAHATLEQICLALNNATESHCKEAASTILKKSPTSLKVSLRAFQLSESMDFDGCMDQEYRLAQQFSEGHDFKEGIRAVIIDKDQKPNWQPNNINAVETMVIDAYFTSM